MSEATLERNGGSLGTNQYKNDDRPIYDEESIVHLPWCNQALDYYIELGFTLFKLHTFNSERFRDLLLLQMQHWSGSLYPLSLKPRIAFKSFLLVVVAFYEKIIYLRNCSTTSSFTQSTLRSRFVSSFMNDRVYCSKVLRMLSTAKELNFCLFSFGGLYFSPIRCQS
jgi:hypothetical protein